MGTMLSQELYQMLSDIQINSSEELKLQNIFSLKILNDKYQCFLSPHLFINNL